MRFLRRGATDDTLEGRLRALLGLVGRRQRRHRQGHPGAAGRAADQRDFERRRGHRQTPRVGARAGQDLTAHAGRDARGQRRGEADRDRLAPDGPGGRCHVGVPRVSPARRATDDRGRRRHRGTVRDADEVELGREPPSSCPCSCGTRRSSTCANKFAARSRSCSSTTCWAKTTSNGGSAPLRSTKPRGPGRRPKRSPTRCASRPKRRPATSGSWARPPMTKTIRSSSATTRRSSGSTILSPATT